MSVRLDWNKIKLYLTSILVPVALGAIVGLLTSGSTDYAALRQPVLAPPGWLFPIVWTVLYVLMGVSDGLLKSRSLHDSKTTSVYYAQLVVNLLWSVIFFTLKWRLAAFFWVILLDLLVILMAVRFYHRLKAAGQLQVPYILWCIFASYLNLGIVLLNP